jgi:hypothetical protein
MREMATMVAPPYINGAMYHVDFGHHFDVSLVTAAAAANAIPECPEGNER